MHRSLVRIRALLACLEQRLVLLQIELALGKWCLGQLSAVCYAQSRPRPPLLRSRQQLQARWDRHQTALLRPRTRQPPAAPPRGRNPLPARRSPDGSRLLPCGYLLIHVQLQPGR